MKTVDDTLKELKTVDRELHGRITRANERTDRKVGEVHKRVDRVKFLSIGSGGIGGLIAGFLAWFSSGK